MPGRQTVFDAITASQSVELHTFPGLEPTTVAGSVLIEIVGSLQSDFDIDVQGKVHEDGDYSNVDYVEIFIANQGEISVNHIHIQGIDSRYFLIPYPPPLIQLVVTARRGTLTVHVSFVGIPFNVPVGNTKIIELLESILEAVNSNLLNQIGTAEIFAGISTQLAIITGADLSDGEH